MLFYIDGVDEPWCYGGEVNSESTGKVHKSVPYTGEPLARAEGMDWYETALLANPLVALRLSARYLRDLWKTWDGDPRWVLAEYNAGPGPTKRWAKELGGLDWDVAAEQVSYWETRDYVKRVMGNYWTYQAAWEGEK